MEISLVVAIRKLMLADLTLPQVAAEFNKMSQEEKEELIVSFNSDPKQLECLRTVEEDDEEPMVVVMQRKFH